MGLRLEDLLKLMDDRDERRERMKSVLAAQHDDDDVHSYVVL